MEEEAGSKWSLLPPDLLVSIAEQLNMADIARLSAVCGSWAWGLGRVRDGWPRPPPTFRAAKKSTPWLLLPNEDGEGAEYCDFIWPSPENEHGLSRIRISPLPEMAGRICVGGSLDGWIATVDIWLNPRILNPITKEEFLLPPLRSLPEYTKLTPTFSQEGDGSIARITFKHEPQHSTSFENFKYDYVQKIILSSAPPHGIVLLIHCPRVQSKLAMAKVGDLTWTPVDLSEYNIDYLQDAVYNVKHNKFFVVSNGGDIIVLDLKDYHWGSSQPPHLTMLGTMRDLHFLPGNWYVVFSSGGELLQVWRQFQSFLENNTLSGLEEMDPFPIARSETVCIKVFKFDPARYDGKTLASCWVHIEDIGDDAMFLGLNHSICITTSDTPWLRKNSVYFAEDTFYRGTTHRNYTCDGGIYDLKHNKVDRIFFPTYSKVNWPPPAWFVQDSMY